MKTAKFSNGHTDTYKGSRDVKAAWMVTELDTGRVVASGHSLDLEKARKTGGSSIPAVRTLPAGWRTHKNTVQAVRLIKSLGYSSAAEMESDYKAKNADHAKGFKVEVVAL